MVCSLSERNWSSSSFMKEGSSEHCSRHVTSSITGRVEAGIARVSVVVVEEEETADVVVGAEETDEAEEETVAAGAGTVEVESTEALASWAVCGDGINAMA